MTYGVDTTGFVKKTLTVIKSEIETALRDSISPTLSFLATNVFGQITGVIGDKLRELWDVAEAVYRAFQPDSASGDALDNICALTGVYRLAATPSTVTLDQMFLDSGVTVPAGSVVSVGSEGARFVTKTALTNSLGYNATLSVDAESEDNGEIVGLAGTIDTIQTPVSGWSAAAQLTSGNAETYNLTDGWTLTIKVDQGAVQTATFNTGDFVDINNATAAEVATVIAADITGLTASDQNGYVRLKSDTEGTGSAIEVTGGTANGALGFSTTEVKGFNTADAVVGTNLETDEELRARRESLLQAAGSSTVEAIRANLLEIDGVLQVTVLENTTDVTDGDGLPPHSFECVVQRVSWTAAQEQEVAETIWENKPAGIETYGSESDTVTDTQGIDHTIKWSKPTPIPIYIDLTVDTDSDLFPSDGSEQIKAALVAYGDSLLSGQDVIALVFKAIPLDIAGVIDVTVFKIDDTDPPTGTVNIAIATRELATFSSLDIDVTVA